MRSESDAPLGSLRAQVHTCAGQVMLVLGAALVAASCYRFLPAFSQIYARWPEELPVQTRILLAVYPYAFFLPLAAMAVAFMAHFHVALRAHLLPVAFAMTGMLGAYVYWAAYSPVQILLK